MKFKPQETAHGKLIVSLLESIEKARVDLVKGNANYALAELEYAQVKIEDCFTEHPNLRNCFYTQPTSFVIKSEGAASPVKLTGTERYS